jgi:uncharacterized membrane protein YhiD involved in acid resistance
MVKGAFGIVLCLVGAVWVLQGVGVVHGSGMSGHGQYAVLGAVVIVLGVTLLAWANMTRRARRRSID